MPRASVLVFDVGKVLIDWDPRFLYRKIFDDTAKMEWFLGEICHMTWIVEIDRGLPMAEAIAERISVYPDYAEEIRAFDERWMEMVPGSITGSVDILETLRRNRVPNYAITNFGAEKFEVARKSFPFLDGFDGIVVSGRERLIKPDAAIYRLLLDRYGLTASDCLFIDDSLKNVDGARAIGMQAHHFVSPGGLRAELRKHDFAV